MRLFDLHCDTIYECYQKRETLFRNSCALDWKRGQQYQPWCQVFAVWIPDSVRGELAWRQCLEMLAYAKAQASKELCFPQTKAQLQAALNTNGLIGFLGVEGGAALAGKPERVTELAKLGVKVLTVTWNGTNELGNGCMADDVGGLTEVGKQAVRMMERCGIVPDVSHLNEAGFWDVTDLTKSPFIASHSVSMSVAAHPRNLRDEQFCLLRDRGGLVGLTLCAEQLGEQSFDRLYRHLEHFLSLGGEKAVALGCDLDGTKVPEEWRGIGVYEQFAEYLQKRGVSDTCIDRLFFENAHRFFMRLLP